MSAVRRGTPGRFEPPTSAVPWDLAALTSHTVVGNDALSHPTTVWSAHQWVVLGDGSSARWDGTGWVEGGAS